LFITIFTICIEKHGTRPLTHSHRASARYTICQIHLKELFCFVVTACDCISKTNNFLFCRYWAVVHAKTYDKRFSKRNTYFMVVFIWLWSNLLVTPTLYGWSGLGYDYKMQQCAWDDCKSLAYNIILIVFAIFFPLCIITWCYVTLFK